jgi:hypothetical protein
MKLRTVLKSSLGIGIEIIYALTIIVAAYIICFIVSFKK